jgi:hypothetical protein
VCAIKIGERVSPRSNTRVAQPATFCASNEFRYVVQNEKIATLPRLKG